MLNNNFCCEGLSTAINNAGNSGFSVLVAMNSFNKKFFFVQQYRNKDINDSTGILTVGEVGISYCPWCGSNLDSIINNNSGLIKSTFEKNKKFLLDF